VFRIPCIPNAVFQHIRKKPVITSILTEISLCSVLWHGSCQVFDAATSFVLDLNILD
jgi:hypothetical protein